MTTNIRFGVALYNPRWNPDGGRHSALAVNTLQNRLSGKVSIFQAINRNDTWMLNHLYGHLINDEYYYGVVDFGCIRASEDIVLDILERLSQHQDGYDTHGQAWSCTWWVMRALRAVQASYRNLHLPPDDLELYDWITATKAAEMALAPGPLHLVKF